MWGPTIKVQNKANKPNWRLNLVYLNTWNCNLIWIKWYLDNLAYLINLIRPEKPIFRQKTIEISQFTNTTMRIIATTIPTIGYVLRFSVGLCIYRLFFDGRNYKESMAFREVHNDAWTLPSSNKSSYYFVFPVSLYLLHLILDMIGNTVLSA